MLLCDFRDQEPPEITKQRLAVVINGRLPHRTGLCSVIPLSTTPPHAGVKYQCKIELPEEVKAYPGTIKWAKADMIATVSYKRLSLPYERPPFSKRKYQKIILPIQQLSLIRAALLHALHLDT